MGRLEDIYCCICGAPMLESGTITGSPRDQWLTSPTLLTTAHKTENGVELDEYWIRPSFRTQIHRYVWDPNPPEKASQFLYSVHLGPNPPEEASRSVLRLEAHARGVHQFDLLPSGERVDVLTVSIQRRTPAPQVRGRPLYLPVHSRCLKLADYFIDRVGKSICTTHGLLENRITSVKQLWEVLSRRLSGAHSTWPLPAQLPEPHGYFGGDNCRGLEWRIGEDPEYGELLETNPWEIPDLTESILQNLEPMLADRKEEAQNETRDSATKEGDARLYRNLQNADLECDYTYSPDWWCEAFASKEIFPWLWDVDTCLIEEKQRAGCWNWELLIRQLSQMKIHEPNDTSLKLPLALRNRRRIWRLLEEAKVNDIAEPQEKRIAAEAEEARRSRPPVSKGPWSPPGGWNLQNLPPGFLPLAPMHPNHADISNHAGTHTTHTPEP